MKSGVIDVPPALVWPVEEGLGVLTSEILRGAPTNLMANYRGLLL